MRRNQESELLTLNGVQFALVGVDAKRKYRTFELYQAIEQFTQPT
jgi:hypothetical protein